LIGTACLKAGRWSCLVNDRKSFTAPGFLFLGRLREFLGQPDGSFDFISSRTEMGELFASLARHEAWRVY
jgi:hypothetical protein